MNIHSMIGELVVHNRLGSGTICAAEEKSGNYYIYVDFNDGERLRKFMFPYIFTAMKIMTTESTTVLDAIETVTEGKFECDICGKRCKEVVRTSNRLVCRECAKTAVKCSNCDKLVMPDEVVYTIEPKWSDEQKKYICNECAPKYRKCKECGCIFCLTKRIEDYPKISPDLILCDKCLEEISRPCSCCDEWYLEDNLIDVENYSICEDCFQSNTITCVSCGKIAIKDRSLREIDGLCQDCETQQVYREYVINKINENCYREEISWYAFKNARTTPVMTRIRANKGILSINIGIGHTPKFLIVFDLPNRCKYATLGSCTATEFKKKHWYDIVHLDEDRRKETLRFVNGNTIHIWGEPYCIRAVTDYDKDFRKEWYNGFLVYEGNNYGDTSDFYIIGMSD